MSNELLNRARQRSEGIGRWELPNTTAEIVEDKLGLDFLGTYPRLIKYEPIAVLGACWRMKDRLTNRLYAIKSFLAKDIKVAGYIGRWDLIVCDSRDQFSLAHENLHGWQSRIRPDLLTEMGGNGDGDIVWECIWEGVAEYGANAIAVSGTLGNSARRAGERQAFAKSDPESLRGAVEFVLRREPGLESDPVFYFAQSLLGYKYVQSYVGRVREDERDLKKIGNKLEKLMKSSPSWDGFWNKFLQ